jgi:hypothetical protein
MLPTAEDCRVDVSQSVVYVKNKPQGHGEDATVRLRGPACTALYGPGVTDCHLEALGQPGNWRCSWYLIGGCPVWQYSLDKKKAEVCDEDDHRDMVMSCDHFGTQPAQDDPTTKNVFEGLPALCGEQRDIHGPIAGFFTVAHGKGFVRACSTDYKICGPWIAVDH